jgi:hypothetical protein
LPSASLALKKILVNFTWPVVALCAAIGLIACGGGDLAVSRPPTAIAQRLLGAASETPGTLSRLEAAEIRFSQSSYSLSGLTEDSGFYTVEENIQWLKYHPGQELPWGGPIRVFRKQPFMDEWGPLTEGSFTGDPKNLSNGEIYTLDHRRLVAYRMAG